jgi:predicted ATPase/class 3 adenylate cyclase
MPSDDLSRATGSAQRGRRATLPTGVVTLVFTDVEGSTALLRRLGPRYAELLDIHNEIVTSSVIERGGTVVRGEGDAFFCAFVDPVRAVEACLAAQLRLSDYTWPPDGDFRVRIGVHTGQVELGGEDYVGLAVHQAARVGAAAHGGQVTLSEATRQLLGDRLPPEISFSRQGCYQLKDFPEPTVIYQVSHPRLRRDFPALRAVPAAAHNVPEQATLFVGRQTALAELGALVAEQRLVSVLGAGGVGKTRLASEIAPLIVDSFQDGVWMVELAKLREGAAVTAEVAATLGIRGDAERTLEMTIAEALETKRLLLILDNCEHVLDDSAALVQGLLQACPGVHVLATSREPLSLPGERRYPLAPLSLPDGLRDAEGSEAVALFVDRARIVAPAFDLTRNREAVIEICRRLDGLPLAIELAAARAAAIPPSRIASRLDRRFSVLRRSHRGGLPHHETLRASIEWSHELLEDDERVLLARLAVFTGEFELEAAEAVCGSAPLLTDDVLDLLGELIEKSLLQPAGDRYLMLESIREFAREQLEQAGEVEAMIAAHIAYYTELVEEIARQGEGPGQRLAFDRLDAVLPNVRSAVERALQRSDVMALRISAAVGQYGFVRNRLAEVAHWCIDAAAMPGAPPVLRVRALNQAGFALVIMGSLDGGLAVIDDGLALARSAGDRLLLGQSLLMAADLRLEAGREVAARPLAAEAVEVVGELGDDVLLGRALCFVAWAEQEQAGFDATARALEAAFALFKRAGDDRQLARTKLLLAYLSLEAGDLNEAEYQASCGREYAEKLDHVIGRAMMQIVLVWVAIDRGEFEAAGEMLSESLTIASEAGYRGLVGYCIAAEAGLAAAMGASQRAARRLGSLRAEGVLEGIGGEGGRAIGLRLAAMQETLAAELGDAFEELMAEGEQIHLDQLAAQPR